MTVTANPERQRAYDALEPHIPDAHAKIMALMEDLAIPVEYDEHGFDDTHEVAEHIEEVVIEEIENASIPDDPAAEELLEEEILYARTEAYDLVMERFEPPQ
jgi:hypothetical protein